MGKFAAIFSLLLLTSCATEVGDNIGKANKADPKKAIVIIGFQNQRLPSRPPTLVTNWSLINPSTGRTVRGFSNNMVIKVAGCSARPFLIKLSIMPKTACAADPVFVIREVKAGTWRLNFIQYIWPGSLHVVSGFARDRPLLTPRNPRFTLSPGEVLYAGTFDIVRQGEYLRVARVLNQSGLAKRAAARVPGVAENMTYRNMGGN